MKQSHPLDQVIRPEDSSEGATNEAPPQTDERVCFSLRSWLEKGPSSESIGCRGTSLVHQRQTLAAGRSGASPPLIPTQKTKDISVAARLNGRDPEPARS